MNDAVLLDHTPFDIDEAELLEQLRSRRGRAYGPEIRRLAAEAQAVGRPKALYRVAFVEEHGDGYVVVSGAAGVKLASQVLAVNLANVHRAFVFVATAGPELEAWQQSKNDLLEAFWADVIAEMGVRAALAALKRHLTECYHLQPLSMMNPGSLADWPITQQRPLFAVVGDVEERLGVQLTPSLLMVPRKSVSGILFPSAETFASCQLCPRAGCPNRRAPYERELFEKKYARTSASSPG